jgi:hypothetical protein
MGLLVGGLMKRETACDVRVFPERIDEVRHLLLETNPDDVRVELGTPTYRCQGTAVAYRCVLNRSSQRHWPTIVTASSIRESPEACHWASERCRHAFAAADVA